MSFRLTAKTMAEIIADKYGYDMDKAVRVLQIARTHGLDAEPIDHGIIEVTYHSASDRYTIAEFIHADSRGRVAAAVPVRYASKSTGNVPNTRRTTMATRRAAKAEPEPEVEETEERDYTAYADKDATATMVDFGDWLLAEVYGDKYPGDEDDFLNGVRLGGTLRMEFQKSQFCIDRREERKAEREKEAAKPKPARGKGATKAAAEPDDDDDEGGAEAEAPAKPATRTRRTAAAKPTAKASTATGTRRGRGAAKAEALY